MAESSWEHPVADLEPSAWVRIRLGRALAPDPAILLLEHPTAHLDPGDIQRLGRSIRRIAERRDMATLTLTANPDFAAVVASRVLTLDPVSGRLNTRRSRRWFRARLD